MSEQEQNTIQTIPSQNAPMLEESELSLLLEHGGGAAAIIISISILLLAVAEMIKVLVPVMLQRSKPDTKDNSNSS